MKLMTLKQYTKMSKPALIRKITKSLRAMPKVKLARLCYNLTKSKLPRLYTPRAYVQKTPLWELERKRGLWGSTPALDKAIKLKQKRTKKRKFSRKQLAAQRLFAKRARAGTLRKRRR